MTSARQEGDYPSLREEGREIRVWLEPPGAGDAAPVAMVPFATLLAPVVASEAAAAALATSLLTTFRSVTGVFNARPDRLRAVPGMTEAAHRLLGAAHALACQAASELLPPREPITSMEQLEYYVRVKLRGRTTEAVLGLFLDRKDRLIEEVTLGEGTVDQAPVYPREVVRRALILDASAVILIHNHPSGNATFSEADIKVTHAVADALVTVDVALHDHIIVGDNGITSLRNLKRF